MKFEAVVFIAGIAMILVNHYGSLKCAYESILNGSDCRAIPVQEINSISNSKW